MRYETVKWEVVSSPQCPGDNAIGVLTLNVPKRINAISPRMALELDRIVDDIRESGTRVVILTGAGDHFSGGGDLKFETTPLEREEETHGLEGAYKDLVIWWMNDHYHVVAQQVCRKWEDLPQPTIGAIDGVCVGMGFEFTLCCDLRIVSDRVKLSEIAVPAGFMSEWASPRVLPKIVGYARAAEMVLTGRFVLAEEAYRIGLANKVVPADELMDTALKWAGRIAAYPARGTKFAKETLRLYRNKDRNLDDMRLELDRVLELTRTRECAEGVTAFLEKRTPQYHEGNPVQYPTPDEEW
ncbi:MAG: enoyl-CoA hydratase/isomerase family protein [Rhodospirillales bacterium]|jgi:enoyl-CoA hydratase/carnithine racemase|nr:enoyl-CoA hydratase/isomerase family protein [Rhodospirillales bacterium]MDP7242641.1 enoyl-CoA hydratase/isomerase family protein [Rhodospirillales bacterium]